MKSFEEFNEEQDVFMGKNVYEVDHDTYCKCLQGKKHGDKWIKYVEDPEMKKTLQKEYYKQKSVFLKSTLTGNITELVRLNRK